jgi:predicted nucleic acid-binding protein
MTVCVDASLIVALLVPEGFSQAALSLWQDWIDKDEVIVAPGLLRYEVTSALYRKSFRGQITQQDSLLALEQFVRLDISYLDPLGQHRRAMELAQIFQRPNTYDAHYLALAEHLGCPLWSGDERLFNAVRQGFENIHWLGMSTR